MALFKCKMCGGTLEINNETVATCEYCGTQQTLPRLDDDRKTNLYDRANHFRRNNEFDKAMGIYEQILNEDNTDAEAYWSLVLCRYGIEYVEDPSSHKRIPTVNRTQFTSVFDDDNYKSALQYADGYQRSIYEEEARAINEIQKGILAISQKEEPFDVFICYKETDNNGRRTPDSVLANDLYHQLTQEGFKVFFARITLEDKLGSAYEPYIFAALNSAKVMVVLGTKPEYFNAVWVKNEWSRYLALIKQGQKKMLIPAYKDMDPYDLPEEFSHLQAQDMSKLGFMQDLIRGIKKIAQAEVSATTVVKETVIAAGNANTAPLLKRAFMFLEDGDWTRADDFCEQVLNLDPENAQAYLGKLMAELHVKTQESLKDQAQPFDGNNNYQKTIRFADEELKATLTGYIEHINTRNENERLEGIYIRAQKAMSLATTENVYKEAAGLFESIGEYKDAAALAQVCYEKAEILRKDAILSVCKKRIDAKLFTKDWAHIIKLYTTALNSLESISGWKDADEQIAICKKKIEETKAEEEAERLELARNVELANKKAEARKKKTKKIVIIAAPILCAIMAFIIVLFAVIIPGSKYNDAVALMDAGEYVKAISAFEALDGYKDSENKISECDTAILDGKYSDAVALMDAEEYTKAISAFKALDGYKDSADKINECNTAIVDGKYNEAIALMEAGEYAKAISVFEALEGYRDSAAKIYECNYNYAVALMDAGKHADAAVKFVSAGNYSDAHEKATALWNEIAVRDAVSAGFHHTVGLKADGTVVAVGDNEYGQCNVSGWRDIVAVSAGFYHTVGLKSDGTVVATGDNIYGQCNVRGWRDIVAVSAGAGHTVGLKSDGTVVATGDNDVSGWRDVVAVSAGSHIVGLKSDGTVVAVGNNDDGECNVSGWTDIVAVSANYDHTVGLKSDGTVVAVGNNGNGQCDVSGWRDVVAVSAGDSHTVGLKSDGTVVAVGNNRNGRCDVSGWTDIVAVFAGSYHTVGLKADGTVVAVGNNEYGECDVSGWRDIRIPQNSTNKISEYSKVILDSKYTEEISALDGLDSHSNSADKASPIRDKYAAAKVGDYIFFGAYEQDNNISNGKEAIEWLVLEVKDGKALVISKYALDCKQYNTSYTDVTWETSTLRKWLNNDFLNSAFSADEKAMIPTVTVSADKNPEYSTNPGKATQDQVFLLSIPEAIKYFSSDNARQCKPTDYADANGVYVNISNGNCWWWLRSPGCFQELAAYVYGSGGVDEYGGAVYDDNGAVRPALWIDLNS